MSGVIEHLSASQVKTFQRCPRKWFYEKILKIPVPETPGDGKATGTRGHTKMEGYFEQGITPDPASEEILDQSILKLLKDPALPPRQTIDSGVLIEHPRDYMMGIDIGGVPIKGRIDLVYPQPAKKLVSLWDWKTGKTFRYSKKAEELVDDLQMNIYGLYTFTKWPEVERVEYVHGNIRTDKKAEYRIVRTPEPLDRKHVTSFCESVEPVVEEMKQVAKETDIKKVRFNADACNDYGGCPFRNICPLSLMDRLGGYTPPPQPGATSMTPPPEAATTTTTPAPVMATGINPPDGQKPSKISLETAEEVAKKLVEIVRTGEPKEAVEAAKILLDVGFGPEGLELYIDSRPLKGLEAQSLEDEVHARLEEIRTGLGLSDVRDGKLAFGKWRVALAESFRTKPITGRWYVTSGGEFNQAALDHLKPLAAIIVTRAG